jgi:hypothetical protein
VALRVSKEVAARLSKGHQLQELKPPAEIKPKPQLEAAPRCDLCGRRLGAFFKRGPGWKCLPCVKATEPIPWGAPPPADPGPSEPSNGG